jgi:hypothetical protein
MDHGLLNVEASRSHSDKRHSIGLLWTSDHPKAETSTWQHTALPRYINRTQWSRASYSCKVEPIFRPNVIKLRTRKFYCKSPVALPNLTEIRLSFFETKHADKGSKGHCLSVCVFRAKMRIKWSVGREGNSIPAYRLSKTRPFPRRCYYDCQILALCYSWYNYY